MAVIEVEVVINGPRKRCSRRTSDYSCDLVEGHIEHVVQHEGEALIRRQRLHGDQQRLPERVRDDRFSIPVDLDGRGLLGCRQFKRLLTASAARSQHVQRDAGQPLW